MSTTEAGSDLHVLRCRPRPSNRCREPFHSRRKVCRRSGRIVQGFRNRRRHMILFNDRADNRCSMRRRARADLIDDLNGVDHLGRPAPDIIDPLRDSLHCLGGLGGERLHLRRYHREALSGGTGSRRLDCRVQGEQVGLPGNDLDEGHNISDRLCCFRRALDRVRSILRPQICLLHGSTCHCPCLRIGGRSRQFLCGAMHRVVCRSAFTQCLDNSCPELGDHRFQCLAPGRALPGFAFAFAFKPGTGDCVLLEHRQRRHDCTDFVGGCRRGYRARNVAAGNPRYHRYRLVERPLYSVMPQEPACHENRKQPDEQSDQDRLPGPNCAHIKSPRRSLCLAADDLLGLGDDGPHPVGVIDDRDQMEFLFGVGPPAEVLHRFLPGVPDFIDRVGERLSFLLAQSIQQDWTDRRLQRLEPPQQQFAFIDPGQRPSLR